MRRAAPAPVRGTVKVRRAHAGFVRLLASTGLWEAAQVRAARDSGTPPALWAGLTQKRVAGARQRHGRAAVPRVGGPGAAGARGGRARLPGGGRGQRGAVLCGARPACARRPRCHCRAALTRAPGAQERAADGAPGDAAVTARAALTAAAAIAASGAVRVPGAFEDAGAAAGPEPAVAMQAPQPNAAQQAPVEPPGPGPPGGAPGGAAPAAAATGGAPHAQDAAGAKAPGGPGAPAGCRAAEAAPNGGGPLSDRGEPGMHCRPPEHTA